MYTNSDYWNNYWREENREEAAFYFEELMDQYIDWTTVESYMEIGGAPGSIMTYMHKKHNIKVSTIDFTEKSIIESYMIKHGVTEYEVQQEDFLKYDLKENPKKYSFVASWGFVEHFSKPICSEIIKKQIEMSSEDGYIVVELPNIRRFIWVIYFLFNRSLLKIHNFEVMDLDFLRKEIKKSKNVQILYSDYYLTMNAQNDYFVQHPTVGKICSWLIGRVQNLKMSECVKRWFYPYIVIIGKREKCE